MKHYVCKVLPEGSKYIDIEDGEIKIAKETMYMIIREATEEETQGLEENDEY